MFECLLLFLHETKQRCWQLYISFHISTKCFLKHIQQNYVCIVPVYFVEMYALKEEEPEVWQFLRGTSV